MRSALFGQSPATRFHARSGPPDCWPFAPDQTVLDLIDLLPPAVGVSHPPASDEELQRSISLRRNRDAYAAHLRERAASEPLAAYAWATSACGSLDPRDLDVDRIFDAA